MPNDEKIRRAIEIIGTNKPKDYVINPTAHYEIYSETARDFAQMLKSPEISKLAVEYEHYDKEAREKQSKFNKQSKHARWAVFWAACFSAGLVSAGSWSSIAGGDSVLPTILIIIFGLGSVLAGAYAGVCIRQIRFKKLLEEWMESRSEAESARLSLFEEVVRYEGDNKEVSGTTLPLLQLEYFRRYQFDVQHTYYNARSEELSQKSDSRLTLISYLFGAVTAVNGIAGVVGATKPKWAALAGIALIIQALSTMLTNAEAVNQDRRNSERYKRTFLALDIINNNLENIRSGVARGNKEVMYKFAAAVHEPISAEHQQWVKDFKKRSKALGQLSQELENIKRELQTGNSG